MERMFCSVIVSPRRTSFTTKSERRYSSATASRSVTSSADLAEGLLGDVDFVNDAPELVRLQRKRLSGPAFAAGDRQNAFDDRGPRRQAATGTAIPSKWSDRPISTWGHSRRGVKSSAGSFRRAARVGHRTLQQAISSRLPPRRLHGVVDLADCRGARGHDDRLAGSAIFSISGR